MLISCGALDFLNKLLGLLLLLDAARFTTSKNRVIPPTKQKVARLSRAGRTLDIVLGTGTAERITAGLRSDMPIYRLLVRLARLVSVPAQSSRVRREPSERLRLYEDIK